jgi:hypothetical protein
LENREFGLNLLGERGNKFVNMTMDFIIRNRIKQNYFTNTIKKGFVYD